MIEFITSLISLVIYISLSSKFDLKVYVVLALSILINFNIKKDKIEQQTSAATWRMMIARKIDYAYRVSKDIGYAKDIRVFDLGKLLKSYGAKWTKDLSLMLSKVYKKMIRNDFLTEVIYGVANVYIFLYLSKLVISQQMSLPTFTMYLGIVTGIQTQFTFLLDSYGSLSVCIQQMGIFRDKIKEDESEKTLRHVSELKPPYKLSFENVSFSYGEKKVFDHFNLVIEPGEKIAVIGINGSGKSTLIKLLCRFYELDEGAIKINGVNIKDFDLNEYYSFISAVFQDIEPLAFTIRENITSQQDDDDSIMRAMDVVGMRETIEALPQGLDTPLTTILSEDGTMLSGGQMQKLMMARAIYKEASILILDEPTSALDVEAEQRLYKAYYDLCENKTSIFISHRLASTKVCDRIVLIEHGRMIESGTHEALMRKKGAYYEMYEVQRKYYKEEKENECFENSFGL